MPLASELGLPIPDVDDEGNGPIYPPSLRMDLAKSSAAACRSCGKKFVKGDPRIACIFNSFGQGGGWEGSWYDSTTSYYYHVKCGCDRFKKHFTISEVGALSSVPKKEQDMVKKAFPKTLPKAKAKPEPKASVQGKAKAESTLIAKRPAAAEHSEAPTKKVARARGSGGAAGSVAAGTGLNNSNFVSKTTEISGWSNDKLKKLLKANDQSQTGNKQVLIAKCAFGMVFGKLPRCPECHGGRIKFRLSGENGDLASLTALYGGASAKDHDEDKTVADKQVYYCSGYFDDDEKVECHWQSSSVVFGAWVDA